MGVPKQVVEMEAEGDRDIAAAEANPIEVQSAPAETAAEPPKAEPKGETQEAKPEGKANLLSQVAEIQATDEAQRRKEEMMEKSAMGRLRDLQGKLSAQHEAYEKKVGELESKIAELTEKLSNVRIGDAPSAKDMTEDEIFAEVRKEYSEDDYSDDDLKRFIRIVNKVGMRSMRDIQRRLDEYDEERSNRVKATAKAEADSFVEKLNAEFPGFREIDANNDPRWISFLSSSIGGVMEGTSYGDVAKEALRELNYRKFSAVVREFAKQANIVFSPNAKPVSGSVASQVRPDSVAGSMRDSTKATPRIVPMAEIEAFRKAAFAHRAEERYGLTRDEVAARLRFYEDAEAEGRVR